MNIQIIVKGDKETKAKLNRLGKSIYNLKHAMELIGRDTAKYFSSQGFSSQGGVFGNPWQPLARSTSNEKNKTYPGRPPLVRTGEMQNSFEFNASNSSVVIGNTSQHFKYHQSTLPRRKIPRRQTMGINDPVKRIVSQHIHNEIRKKIASA